MRQRFLLLIACLTGLFFPENAMGQLYLNELVTSNSAGISDPDFDETGDWIEIFNAGNTPVNLSNFTLTDNLNNFDKWTFPDNTQIAANDFLLIWADGENQGLHTNFKLTKDGEEIGLFDDAGNRLDSVIYKNQKTDVSYGRKTDGNSEWGFFENPTPASNNTTTAYDGIVFYPVRFSVKGGFYENNFSVTLASSAGEIRYTTNGDLPNLNSPLYTQEISIEATTVLRASVFLPNYIAGKPNTQSYFLREDFEERGLPVVSIATNPDYFWDAQIGLYTQDFKPPWEYPINIELFENDGGDRAVFNELAGVKVNGLYSWQSPQKMLGIYFDNEYDQNSVDYPLFFDRKRNRYENFILRASGSDWNSTLFRDGIMHGLVEGMTDLEGTGFRPTSVFVNGEYLGIHNLRSRLDDGFFEENFGLEKNEYDLIENFGIVENGDTIAFTEFYTLLRSDLSQPANYAALSEIMDIDNCIDFYVTELWSSNSSYGHNINFWKTKSDTSKWRWMIQDFDRGFYGAQDGLLEYFTTDGPDNYSWVSYPFRDLISNPEFSNAFLRRAADHMFTTFHPRRVKQNISKFSKTIANEIPHHVNRWSGINAPYASAIPSEAYWKAEVESMRIFSEDRMEAIYKNLIENFPVEGRAVLGIETNLRGGGSTFINNQPIPTENWSGYYFQNLSFELRATPDLGHQFLGWSTAEVETLITKEAEWKYSDNGNLPASNWTAVEYNDATWNAGPAQLGFGDDDENTIVSYGGDVDNKHLTTYFRKSFTIENPADYSGQLLFNLLRDDGVVVYLNGQEIHRSNLPEGSISNSTPALYPVMVDLENENHFFTTQVAELQEGENVVAVEIHQIHQASSDLSFDLEMKAVRTSDGNIFSTENTISANLQEDQVFVANYVSENDCILPDTIFNNTTLTIDCSPYFVPKKVTVMPEISLTVEEGVHLIFAEKSSLVVHGDLQVEGSETSPVKFLPNAENGETQWGQVFFENATDTSRLNWFTIEGASTGAHPIREKAALAIWNSVVEMNHLDLTAVLDNPILARYSDIWLRNSFLHSEVTGDLINVKYGYGFVDSCDFRGNDQVDTDAIDYDEVENGVIQNSKIYNFLGFNSDGIDLGEGSENVRIENNFIHHITDKGISVGQRSTIVTKNNTIVECALGVGVKDEAVAIIDQSTFYNNVVDVSAFEKNVGIGGGNIEVYNSIFTNTVDAPVFADSLSEVSLSYLLSDTDSLLGGNIFWGNPRFENPTQNDFRLSTGSPAINAGIDLLGNAVNLGTQNFQYAAPPSLVISSIHYHPADNAEKEYLQIFNPSNETIDIGGYAFTKGIIFTFPEGRIITPQGFVKIAKDKTLHAVNGSPLYEWTSGSLSNDGEQIILTDAAGIVVDHVTYNDQLPWPIEADGGGPSLELISADLDNHFAESWNGVTVSLEDALEEKGRVSIFPNPATTFITIKMEGEQLQSVVLFDALGRSVLSKKITQGVADISVGQLSAGFYVVQVNGERVGKLILTE